MNKTLNWTKIQKDYPKAYNELVGSDAETQVYITCADTGTPLTDMDYERFTWRDLYEFFDGQGIIVCPLYYIGLNFWKYQIIIGKKGESLGKFDCREEAEIAGFYKAFKLLEDNL